MITDLTYLKNMTDGDTVLIREMIDIFAKQVMEYTDQMKDLYQQSDWPGLSRLAHKAKSSLAIMGMKDMAGKMKELEILAREGKEVDQYSRYIAEFIDECQAAVDELNSIELL